ncbi:MAG: YdcF family protein [Ruminococcaceae bacterium]|nr:YdcF family protein [Oscillospiraceae bacterium]
MEKDIKKEDFSADNALENEGTEIMSETETDAGTETEPVTEKENDLKTAAESIAETETESETETAAETQTASPPKPKAPKMICYIKKAVWIMLLAFETAAIVMFVSQMPLGIRNIGAIFGLCMSVFALLVTAFIKTAVKILKWLWKRKSGKTVTIVFFSVFGLLTVYAVLLSSLMIGEIMNTPHDPDAVIVLGCRVQRNGKPSLMLGRRIEAAYEYLSENENVICIVSGGKGEDEPISEGEAMKVALVEKGIDESRIFVEDKSENTKENIEFSARLLDEMGMEINEAAIVTDGFHLYRASLMAKGTWQNTTSVAADTPWWLVTAYWFREWFALSSLFVFG